MNAWNFDEDSSSDRSAIRPSKRDSAGASFQVKKHAFFAEDDNDNSFFQSREPPSSRRKQSSTGHKELVLYDDDDDLDDRQRDERQSQPQLQQPGHSIERGNRATCNKAAETDAPHQNSLKSAKVDETGIPDVIHTVLRTKVSQPTPQSSSRSTASSSADAPSASSASNKKRVSLADLSQGTTELLMHYFVREFLKLHVPDDAVVGLFDKERVRVNAISSDAKLAIVTFLQVHVFDKRMSVRMCSLSM